MSDACFVCFGEAFRDLHRDLQRGTHRQDAGAQQVTQSLAFDQFHGDVVAGAITSQLIDRYDIFMVESGSGASFLVKAMQELGILRDGRTQKFEGDHSRQANISRAINIAHTARAQAINYFEWPKFAAWSNVHTWPRL